MSTHHKPYFNPDNLVTIEDVLVSLDILGHDLPLTELEQLNAFNQAYLIITRNIRQELMQDTFDYPEFVELFDTRLSYHYLHSLQKYLLGREVPRSWQRAFDAVTSGAERPIACMALGLNAVVNNDIPLVLRDCRADQRHYRDFRQIHAVIRHSFDEIVAIYNQPEHQPRQKIRHYRPAALYRFGTRRLLSLWRYTAWHNFNKLMRYHTGVVVVESNTGRTGDGIGKLPI